MSASFQLVMKSAPYPDKEFPLTRDEMTVGRDTANEIVISDAEVSRRHARIYKVGETFMIEDLGSTNGTFINGQRLSGPHALQAGETVRFGETITLLFEAPVQAQAYDPNATMMTPGGAFSLPQTPPPTFESSLPTGGSMEGVVAGVGDAVPKKNNNRTLIMVGVGCLILLCCVCAVSAFAFDYFNLYYLIGM